MPSPSSRNLAITGGAIVLMVASSFSGALIYHTFWGNKKRNIYLTPKPTHSFSSYQDTKAGMPQAYPDFVLAAEMARPAVVHIRSQFSGNAKPAGSGGDFFGNPFRDFWQDEGSDDQDLASGSGVLISADGYVATNNHVVQGADRIEVTLLDNRRYVADVIGTDVSTDLALLKIEGDALPFLKFGNSDKLRIGQWVLAVGNPLDLNSTVTAGIISARGRNLNLLREDSDLAVESFIQTDAAVNRGNSGGALISASGELVGINTAIASRTGYYAGYSFAIPAVIVQKVLEDLVRYGEVRRGFLGVQIQPVDADVADDRGLSVLQGAYISSITPKGGAAQGGLLAGDVIVGINHISVNSTTDLQEQVSRFRPGEKIEVEYVRGKDTRTTSVVLRGFDGSTSGNGKTTMEYKGSRFRLLTEKEQALYGVDGGVKIEVLSSTMRKSGVQDNFVITDINGKKIRSIEALQRALASSTETLTVHGLYSKGVSASYSFSW